MAAFLPGLFFEISVALANPTFVGKITANLSRYSFSQYINLGIALFVAFVIGNGFMMGVSLIQWLIAQLYLRGFYLRKLCYQKLVIPRLERFAQNRTTVRRSLPWWFTDVQKHLRYFAYGGNEEEESINGCLGILASNLLETKYAISREDSNHTPAWWIWYVTLAKPTQEETRGQTFMIASHATGWSGLVATRLASTLSNRYYLSFCVLLIVSGLFHDFYVTRYMNNPITRGLANIRGMLREFRKPLQPHPPKGKDEA
jgi:hypothetical protein